MAIEADGFYLTLPAYRERAYEVVHEMNIYLDRLK